MEAISSLEFPNSRFDKTFRIVKGFKVQKKIFFELNKNTVLALSN